MTFQTRHYHVYDWHTRVLFACVQDTLIGASKHRGRVKNIATPRERCKWAKGPEGQRGA